LWWSATKTYGRKKISVGREQNPLNIQSPETTLNLGAGEYTLWKTGIEFRSATPLKPWTEMAVQLTTVADQKNLRATGVIVDCRGDRHKGYHVTMAFMETTQAAQQQINHLVLATARQPQTQQPRLHA
jgi:hypothetical protein